ncbi:MAG: DNA methylase [Bacteroidales bacterium]|nr:DNA methylase [Bacteroidales bacterium]
MERERQYIAIDLKSFYASVECVERGLDPLTTNLVVADVSRTDKTICLAVTPSLKAYGIPGRARLFEVKQRLRQVNFDRLQRLQRRTFSGKSYLDAELSAHPDWEVDFIAATPRMAYYIDYSTRVYRCYLKYVSPEDIFAYSIDEVFIDVTNYLESYKMNAHQLAMAMVRDVLKFTGVTATAGIGTNLYLAKVAMDIVAKHLPADADGVRIAELDERSYREQLWNHRPITSFWRVGRGIANRLASLGITTMGQLARYSLNNEKRLYQMFGVNAELLIDHAWGWEPCTMQQIKTYRPSANSLSNGQVLQSAYTVDKARIVVQEMADSLSLQLVSKHKVALQVGLYVGYDRESLTEDGLRKKYSGEVVADYYGRVVPKPAHGTIQLSRPTSSSKQIIEAVLAIFDSRVDSRLKVRRLNVVAGNVVPEERAKEYESHQAEQLDLFTDYDAQQQQRENEDSELAKERKVQEALLSIKSKYGKNAILKGINFEEGATMKDRNQQIGGHKA